MNQDVSSHLRFVFWSRLTSALLVSLLCISFNAFALLPPILLAPTNGTIVVPGEHFTVSGHALDFQAARIEFYQDDVLIRSVLNTTATFTWSNSTLGWHTYKLLVFDAQGAYTSSAEAKLLTCRPDSLATFFPEFTASAGLTLEKSAAIVGNYLSLTTNASGKGGAWFPTRQPLTHGFDTVFQFRIADQVGGGADGIAFVIEGTPTAALGGGIGYSGVTNSLAVEYDTFINPNHQDPNDNHISVHSRGTYYNTNWESLASLGWTTNIPNMSDGAVHTTRILYIPPELQVFLDDMANPALVVDVALSTFLNLPNGSAWIGLTATTGASQENHYILAWSFTGVLDPLPQLRQIQVQGNGTILLNYIASAGLRYRVQYSYDLSTWLDSASLITGTGNWVNWVDVGPPETEKFPANASIRFYRLRVIP